MNLNEQLLNVLQRELADLEYRMKRTDELTAEIDARTIEVKKAIAELTKFNRRLGRM